MFEFKDLEGKIFRKIDVVDEEICFRTDDKVYVMLHHPDCCEHVYIEDICGDIDDLLDSPILLAEEAENPPFSKDFPNENSDESFTWTFYKLSTIKGSVTIRWYGSSNGYYSESVSVYEQNC